MIKTILKCYHWTALLSVSFLNQKLYTRLDDTNVTRQLITADDEFCGGRTVDPRGSSCVPRGPLRIRWRQMAAFVTVKRWDVGRTDRVHDHRQGTELWQRSQVPFQRGSLLLQVHYRKLIFRKILIIPALSRRGISIAAELYKMHKKKNDNHKMMER